MKAKNLLRISYQIILAALCSIMLLFPSIAHASEVDINGHWEGDYFVSQVKGKLNHVAFYLEQSDDGKVKGKYDASTGVHGSGEGYIVDNLMFMRWTNTVPPKTSTVPSSKTSHRPCPGKYDAIYTIASNTSISWSFTGRDCLGKEVGYALAVKGEKN
ncbi:MAG: hypothetical protein F6J96_02155 [Symploca sp. SIO1C2]|nr:hypothetical protein [Symploca sp. SIO1C2]